MSRKTENRVTTFLWILFSVWFALPFVFQDYHWLVSVYIVIIPTAFMCVLGLLLELINKIVGYRSDIIDLKSEREKKKDHDKELYKEIRKTYSSSTVVENEFQKACALEAKMEAIEKTKLAIKHAEGYVEKYTNDLHFLNENLDLLEGKNENNN